jgi:glycosyltransferase involved in cell wall biosynthesis
MSSRPLRILYVINGLGTGGAERSLAELLPRLTEAGIRPTVACLFRREEGVEGSVRRNGFDVRILTANGLPGRIRELGHMISADRPDIVHTTIFEADIAGRLAAVRRGPRVMTSLVSTPYSPIRLADPRIRRLRLRSAQLLDSWTARHLTDHFHATSHAAKKSGIESLAIPPVRITVIERGRDPVRLGEASAERRRRSRERLGLRESDEVVVSVGRQEFAKGQRHLLEAAHLMARSRPRLVVLIAGRKGNASQELEEIRDRASLHERVRFLGHRDDVPEILAAGDVFVLPSLYEGFPGTLIEAMALGLPIVASNLDAVREIVVPGRNAELISTGSARDLARAVSKLLDEPRLARAYGARGRVIFESRFTLAPVADKMFALYRMVAGRSATGRAKQETR